MDLLTQVDRAHELALIAHKDQKYGDEDYFAHHVQGVVRNVHRLYYAHPLVAELPPRPVFSAAGLLHDAVEDSDLTLDDLIDEKFDPKIVRAVELVTKPNDKTNFDLNAYLDDIAQDEVAVIVKRADILFNMSSCVAEINGRRFVYYSEQLARLLK